MSELVLSICGIIISIVALFTTIFFSILGARANKRNEQLAQNNKELSETQKILAMLSVLSPAVGNDRDAWRMLMRYLISKDKLPYFNDDDYQLMSQLMSRLEMKIEIVNGKVNEH